jgi:hypothetical protein
MQARKADASGRLRFKNQVLKVGKAFIRENLGIREKAGDGIHSLWRYSTKIGRIDLIQRSAFVGNASAITCRADELWHTLCVRCIPRFAPKKVDRFRKSTVAS